MVKATYISHPLQFTQPSGTSRGILYHKPCWYIMLTDSQGKRGMGEVSLIPGLSVEDPEEVEIQLDHVCKLISLGEMDPLQHLPSLPGIRFALECAMLDLQKDGTKILFESDFTLGKAGIPINGLIWMGEPDFMKEQIRKKLDQGFRVLKLKVGALKQEEEVELLRWIRSDFGAKDLEIRLDANGAWSPGKAPLMMAGFARFDIHSIEQPIGAGQPEAMATICSNPAIPVALDEEIIGISPGEEGRTLLEMIKPQFVILKPGLLGGFSQAMQWINLAEQVDAGWWITSALESSLGLSAIAQWTYQLDVSNTQGLGTGKIYSNNLSSPLRMEGAYLWYREEKGWDLEGLLKT